jgi:hypothetical protein
VAGRELPKKAMGIGALGLILIVGTAYRFLSEPEETKDKPDKGETALTPK